MSARKKPAKGKAHDPLAGIPADLQAKMRDPEWRAAFNAPLTPERARAAGMPPVDVLALMLGRWLRLPAATRTNISNILRVTATFHGESEAADVLRAIDMVAAEASKP